MSVLPIPTVECSHCHVRYVLRVAQVLSDPAHSEWLYQPDCKCRKTRALRDVAQPAITGEEVALRY